MKNLVYIITYLFLLVSCGNSSSDSSSMIKDQKSIIGLGLTEEANEQTITSSDIPNKPESDIISSNKVAKESLNRMLIKKGWVSFESTNVLATYNKVLAIAQSAGAYISDDRLDNYGYEMHQSLVLRIPAENFDSVLHTLESASGGFISKQINVSDVTEAYMDLEARLTTKYAMEKSYLELLKKSKNVNEMLNVERELGYIREEIESMEGSLRYYANNVSFSTLNIDFYEYKDTKAVNFFGEIGQQFKSGWRGLKTFFLSLISAWPILIALLLGVLGFKKWWNSRFK